MFSELTTANSLAHTVVLNDIKHEHLCRLVEYLYCGKTKVAAGELNEFFLSVRKFKILGLHEPSNTNNLPVGPTVPRAHRSLTHESDDDDDVDVDVDENEHNQSGKPGQHGTKRKIVENPNETPRKSIQNMPKHTSTLSQQPVNGNGTQQPPDTGSPSLEETATPIPEVAVTKRTKKHVTPRLEQFTNDDIRKAMKALNTQDFKHATVILVAKEMGLDITNNNRAVQKLCGKMVFVAKG